MIKIVLLVVALIPAWALAAQSLRHALGDNPIETLMYETGDWTMLLLAATLAITPLRRITGIHSLISFRRMLGLLTFYYGCLHCGTYLWLDKSLRAIAIFADLSNRQFILAGLSAFILMIPLALTSNIASIRRLGHRWRDLHRWIYVIAVAAVIHYVWMRPHEAKPYFYLVLFSALLLARLPKLHSCPEATIVH